MTETLGRNLPNWKVKNKETTLMGLYLQSSKWSILKTTALSLSLSGIKNGESFYLLDIVLCVKLIICDRTAEIRH